MRLVGRLEVGTRQWSPATVPRQKRRRSGGIANVSFRTFDAIDIVPFRTFVTLVPCSS